MIFTKGLNWRCEQRVLSFFSNNEIFVLYFERFVALEI